jgi:hypothetical protein
MAFGLNFHSNELHLIQINQVSWHVQMCAHIWLLLKEAAAARVKQNDSSSGQRLELELTGAAANLPVAGDNRGSSA